MEATLLNMILVALVAQTLLSAVQTVNQWRALRDARKVNEYNRSLNEQFNLGKRYREFEACEQGKLYRRVVAALEKTAGINSETIEDKT